MSSTNPLKSLRASVLQVDSYFVESFQFSTLHNFEPDSKGSALQAEDLQWDLEHALTPDNCMAYRLKVVLPEENSRVGYAFDIVLTGIFVPDASYDQEQAQHIADVNAPAVLYGAAREFVAMATGRGPFNALCLPSVTFHEMGRA